MQERHLEIAEAFQVELKLTYVLVKSQSNSVVRADFHVHNHVPAIMIEVGSQEGPSCARQHEKLFYKIMVKILLRCPY